MRGRLEMDARRLDRLDKLHAALRILLDQINERADLLDLDDQRLMWAHERLKLVFDASVEHSNREDN